jgi:hypothetical protein
MMRRYATKDLILEGAGYAYNFDRALYINRRLKKAFSIEFVEDNTDEEIKARMNQKSDGRWQFYFNSEPSDSVKGELERILG